MTATGIIEFSGEANDSFGIAIHGLVGWTAKLTTESGFEADVTIRSVVIGGCMTYDILRDDGTPTGVVDAVPTREIERLFVY